MTFYTRTSALVAMLALACAAPALAQEQADEKPIEKIGDTLKNMGEKPLRDFNIKQDEIPPELLAIMESPYSMKGLRTCTQFRNEIGKLTAVLGTDVDSVNAVEGETAAETMLGAAESVVGSLIPGTGLIRRVTGAHQAEMKAQAAILAGSLRRSYIKGYASARGCKA